MEARVFIVFSFRRTWFNLTGRIKKEIVTGGKESAVNTMSIFKRVKVLSRIAEMDETSPKKCEAQAAAMLAPSPISSIVRGLMYSTLSPSNPSIREDSGGDQIQGKQSIKLRRWIDASFYAISYKNECCTVM